MCNGRGRNRENGSTLVHIGAEYQKQEGGRGREGGGTIWHFCPWAPPLLGESLLRATNSNLSKYLVQRSLSKLAPF